MALKRVGIEVTDETPTEALWARWQDGTTLVMLGPDVPPVTGFWDTDRGSDIDSNGGSDHATYFWDRPHDILYLNVTSTPLERREEKTFLTLRGFTEIRVGLRGRGGFSLHGRNHAVAWRIYVLARNTPRQSAAADNDNAQSARAYIDAAKAAPHRKELELNQAESFAREIRNISLRQQVMDEITRAR
jgi:hypothetical protein